MVLTAMRPLGDKSPCNEKRPLGLAAEAAGFDMGEAMSRLMRRSSGLDWLALILTPAQASHVGLRFSRDTGCLPPFLCLSIGMPLALSVGKLALQS